MISYAQNREDVLLARFFRGDEPQFYIDVGAGHPTIHSVTRHFYEQGWRGIHFEPRQNLLDMLIEQRPGDKCFPYALSSEPGSTSFYTVNVQTDTSGDQGGLSTLDPVLAERHRKEGYNVQESSVVVRRLQDVLEEENVNSIGFLKIDVEGFELQVVKGLDWHRWRPRVVVMESALPQSDKRTDGKAELWIESHGYHLATFDGLNSYYVRVEDSQRIDRLAAPVSVFDSYQTYEQHQLKQQLNDLEVHLKAVKEINSHLTAENARVMAENTGLTAENARVMAENAGLTAENGRLTIENIRVIEEVNNLRRESALANAALQNELATPLWKKAERAIRVRRRAAVQTLVRQVTKICGQ